jgi:Carbohydrate binding module (family 6)/Domain of unknown function (DUF362)
MNAPDSLASETNGKPNGNSTICRKTGRILLSAARLGWRGWVFAGMGLASLAWFLLRVIPKPSRASYPCQRAAFPLASSFVVWLTALLGSAFAFRKLRVRDQRFWKMCLWGAAALAGCALVFTSLPTLRTFADNPPHGPLGIAKGLFPGRVAWVYAPGATTWDGYTSPEHWYDSNHCDLATVELMLSRGLQSVGGANSDAAAWNAIFMYFNQNHSRGTRGYQAGEKVAIKINLTTCNARSGSSTVNINGDYEKNNAYDGHWLNSVDAAPQVLLSLLRQLVYKVGVAQADISVGDPTGNFPKYLWDRLHPEFPNVVYFDNYGQQGRTRVQLSSVPFYWSVTNANTPGSPVVMDYVPVPFAQADYLIDLAVPKSHAGAGITVCGKNFYGALLRCPDGYFRDANGSNQPGTLNYSSMHASLPNSTWGPPGLGHYRALVDLLGHPSLGGKTLLFLGDLLFSGQDWAARPYKWKMAPFNGNWPSSLFVSQDPIALDSVCYDFLFTEWPALVDSSGMNGGAEDYLHEAATVTNPPSGTFYDPAKTGIRLASLGVHEHWNNSINKQYSRNLDPVHGTGVELVAITLPPVLSIGQAQNQQVVSWQGLGFNLQTTTNLSLSHAWSTITPLPPPAQGWNRYTNGGSEPARFYQLAVPPPASPPTNTPFFGTNLAVTPTGSTRIQAENYDNGGEGLAYHDTTSGNSGGQYRSEDVDIEACSDTGGGYDVGWTDTGEWLKYSISVIQAGTYTLRLRAAGTAAGTLRVWFDAVNKTGTLPIPSTGGWQAWTSVDKIGIPLSAGPHVMEVELLSGGYNLNWYELSRTGP